MKNLKETFLFVIFLVDTIGAAVNLTAEILIISVLSGAIYDNGASYSASKFIFYCAGILLSLVLVAYEICDRFLLHARTFATRVWPHVFGIACRLILFAIAALVFYQAHFILVSAITLQVYWFCVISACLLLFGNIPVFIWNIAMLSSCSRLDYAKFLDADSTS